jgi:hypothetical protein
VCSLEGGHPKVFPNLEKMLKYWNLPLGLKKRKTIKIKDGNPSIKSSMANENISKHNPKKK